MAEKLEFYLSVKNNGLGKALDESSKKASQLDGILSTALGVFGGNVATKAFDVFVSGFNSIISVGKEAVDAAAQQETAVNNLNNALARSGNYTKQASKDLQDFATQIQAVTIYEDDAILASAAYLESLTNLSANGLKKATSATADLATVLNIDLQSASSLIAKAIEGNTGALGRYGIQVKKGADEAQTLTNVIAALNAKFGGAAAAQLNTYNGSVIALKNAYGEVYEAAGNIIVQNPLIIAGINNLKKELLSTADNTTLLKEEYQSLLNDALYATSIVIKGLADNLDVLTIAFKGITGSLKFFADILVLGVVRC